MANNCDIKYNFFYKNLNNQQNIAVNNLYGPILVIAGPGTGKTQIIAMRIGKILMETDTLSNNILCITYTESGANSIRQRLLECIGNEAYKVNIYTFHSFCNFIIRDNLDYWSNIDLIPINQIEKINILKSIIDELPFNSTLKRFNGDIYFDIYRLNNLFSIIKRENWNIKDIILKSKEYLDKTIYTIDGFFYKKSRNKKLTISGLTEKKRINQLIDAINLFPTYIDKMAQLNRYDFDDMIIWTINLLKNKPDILKNLQERYSHILIDEYQDTNESQNFILNQLISFWKNPDIFVVGDDDQSIFKFQGASVKNMAFFIEKYRNFDLKIVVLNKNYRSNHYIIKLSDILINNNQNRIHNKYDTINKKLIPSNTNLKNCKPQIIEYNSVYDELYSTAKYIKTLIKNKYVNPNDIAIIYRNHNLIEPLLIYFDKLNIKYNVKHNNNALNVKIIKQIISIMSYVNNEINDPYSGEDILYKIMHYDFIGINSISIAKISVFLKNYNHNTFLRNFIYSVDKNKNLKNVLNKNEINSLKKLSIKIEIIIKNALENTIQETLEDIIYKFNILNFVMKSSHYEKYINSMNSFIRYIQESINRNSNIDLNQTINNINTMYKYKISIDYNKSMDTNCINCLTAHASKGKEFKYVFLILSNECYWISKKKNYYKYYQIPDVILHHTNIKQNNENFDNITEEERRLFYVSITRSREFLFVSYSNKDFNEKEIAPSQFVLEIMKDKSLFNFINKKDIDYNKKHKFDRLLLNKGSKNKFLNDNLSEKLLKNFILSVSSLNTYLKCPFEFYFSYLLNVPIKPSFNQIYGSAIHYALKKIYSDNIKNVQFDIFYEYFAQFMHINKKNFNDSIYKILLERGKKNLKLYFLNKIEKNSITNNIYVEKYIKNSYINSIPIKGFIDKIEFLDNKNVVITDYKTGSFHKTKFVNKSFCPPNSQNYIGGDYWRQGLFYKILLENDISTNLNVVEIKFDFIEMEKNSHFIETIHINNDSINLLTDQIMEVWTKIHNMNFVGCNKDNCKWCIFIKENKIKL